MATTMHCAPKRSLQRRTSSGSSTAAVFIVTLSAPAARTARTSSTLERPPPMVNGMNTCSAQRAARSMMMSRRSCEAVMSRKIELVGALGVVPRRQLDRVAGVADVDEVDALDHAPVADVEARDDALAVHGAAARERGASRGTAR